MGRRGPRPEPAAVKEKKSSTRRPIGKDPAAALAGQVRIDPPVWLKGDGLKVWNKIAPRLAGMKLLSQTDAETFGRYCRNFARWLKLQKMVDSEGEVYETESLHGKMKRLHPGFAAAVRLDRELQAAEANFGLNPAERQRIFAARAAAAAGGGTSADLFAHGEGSERSNTPAKPEVEAKPKSAIGYLQ
jgi:P27 family predicted phage terminase small subunit